MNRRAILETLEEQIANAPHPEHDVIAVGMMDIDFFKKVNDAYGHVAGDEVLKEVVKRAAGALRCYDLLGRFGGEEFLIVLTGSGVEAPQPVLERIRRVICATPVQIGARRVEVTVSIGGAVRKGESTDELIRAADDALYFAKAHGRNRVAVSGGPTLGTTLIEAARVSA